MGTREWVAVHRKHHAKVETGEDPHSPLIKGIRTVLWQGTELYKAEAARQQTLDRYGHETPDDWIERHVYCANTFGGIITMFLVNFLLFGFIGITIWAIQMMWIPFFAAGVINGVGHWRGYRNFESPDASTNIVPWGVLIGGEELHNNHHAFASSARFSIRPWEFDIGWAYICLLQKLGLAKVKKLAPMPYLDNGSDVIDGDTVSAVITNRLHVMSDYAREVIGDIYRDEMRKANLARRRLLRKSRKLINRTDVLLDQHAQQSLQSLLEQSSRLKLAYEYRLRLQAIWQEKSATHEHLIEGLREWCTQAEQTGIEALEDFAKSIRMYTLRTVTV